MPITEKQLFELRDELREYNPSIGLPQIRHLILPTAYMTRLDKHSFWADEKNRNLVPHALYNIGCTRIIENGLATTLEPNKKLSYTCFWEVYSSDFLKPLNELNHEEMEKMSIDELAKKLDIVNKTKLIVDTSNSGNYFWIPEKEGDKTIAEACSIATVTKKEELPMCSLKRIFGDDFKVKVATPKELSERILIPWIDKSWGPFPQDLWIKIKKMVKEIKSLELDEFKRRIEGEPVKSTYTV
jgi:hypothetical protein